MPESKESLAELIEMLQDARTSHITGFVDKSSDFAMGAAMAYGAALFWALELQAGGPDA